MMLRKWWFAAGGLAVVFFVALGVYVYSSETNEQSREQSSTDDTTQRPLQKSVVKSKVDKVEDNPSVLFNDANISQAWGLKKSDAARAWSVSKGSRDVIVAVIDTGVDEKHEDLVHNLWMNPGETGLDSKGHDKASNGIDDDGNGFVDDVHGWNFVGQNNHLDDNHGHGTHIACIIGAEGGNGKGIVGVSPEVSLMVLKYYDPKVPGADNLKNTVAAIHYAVKMGANIINYSGGGTEFSQEEHDAIAEAEKKGILFVAAAGNERSNSDQHHYYPADYKLKNIISVTAIDPSTEVLSSSNYGVETVDIAAPGQNILSCLPGNAYGYMTGTSQATAFVSAAGALVKSMHKAALAEEIKRYILATGDAQEQLSAKTRTSRLLNLYKALAKLDQGVSAMGVSVADSNTTQSFTVDGKTKASMQDPNESQESSVNAMTGFGHSLMNALGKPKVEKLGTQQQGAEGL